MSSNLTKEWRVKLLAALEELRATKQSAGLCRYIFNNVGRHLRPSDHGELLLFIYDCFETWPEFSGNLKYPIPAPIDRYEEQTGRKAHYAAYYFEKMLEETSFFDGSMFIAFWCGEWGAARLRLLDFILSKLYEAVKSGDS